MYDSQLLLHPGTITAPENAPHVSARRKPAANQAKSFIASPMSRPYDSRQTERTAWQYTIIAIGEESVPMPRTLKGLRKKQFAHDFYVYYYVSIQLYICMLPENHQDLQDQD